MKKLIFVILIISLSFGIAQAKAKVSAKTAEKEGLTPVYEPHYTQDVEKLLLDGCYESKLIPGCDKADPIYEADVNRPLAKLYVISDKKTLALNKKY